jgi:apolipoprotein N-acyltransferase
MSGFISPKTPLFQYIHASISGALVAISALYPSLYILTWIAFVPLLIVLQRAHSIYHAYKLGLCTGLALFTASTYWLVDFAVIFKKYDITIAIAVSSLYWIYSAQMLALIAVITWYYKRFYALMWLFPVVITVFFAYFPTLFSVQLGETQSKFLLALQGIAITGVYGLDYIIASVNVIILYIINGKLSKTKRSIHIAYSIITIWFCYGIYGFTNWESSSLQWPTLKIGMVQPNHPPKTASVDPEYGYSLSYPLEMSLTEKLAKQNVDIVIWPETASMHYYSRQFVKRAYQRQINELQTPLIFHDKETLIKQGEIHHYSTSTFLDRHGNQDGQHRKIKLIAFAEYLPWLSHSEGIKKQMSGYLGSFFSDLEPGFGHSVFHTENAAYIPLICYEVMFPDFVASRVADIENPAILVAQSNNSWFGVTRQPFQHLAASVLRSVENRITFVHVINNGPGAVILPSGREIMLTDFYKTAAYAVDVPVSTTENRSFFAHHPHTFIYGITLVFLLFIFQFGYHNRATDITVSSSER